MDIKQVLEFAFKGLSSAAGNVLANEIRKIIQHRYTHSHTEIHDANLVSVIQRLEKGSDYDMLRTGMVKILYELEAIKNKLGFEQDIRNPLSETPIGPADAAIKGFKNIINYIPDTEEPNPYSEDRVDNEQADENGVESIRMSLMEEGGRNADSTNFSYGKGIKSKTSKWIDHVKAHSKKHNISYKQALKSAKESYKK